MSITYTNFLLIINLILLWDLNSSILQYVIIPGRSYYYYANNALNTMKKKIIQ